FGLGVDGGLALGAHLRRLDGAFAAAFTLDAGIGHRSALGRRAGFTHPFGRRVGARAFAAAFARPAGRELAGALAHTQALAFALAARVHHGTLTVALAATRALAARSHFELAGAGAGALALEVRRRVLAYERRAGVARRLDARIDFARALARGLDRAWIHVDVAFRRGGHGHVDRRGALCGLIDHLDAAAHRRGDLRVDGRADVCRRGAALEAHGQRERVEFGADVRLEVVGRVADVDDRAEERVDARDAGDRSVAWEDAFLGAAEAALLGGLIAAGIQGEQGEGDEGSDRLGTKSLHGV